MIGITIAKLSMGKRADPLPPLARISEFPLLFAIGSYMFKCQHCFPGVITPMKPKRRLFTLIFITFFIILLFHLFMAYTAVFWFAADELYDLYTLNFFVPFVTSDPLGDRVLAILGYYIVLYPVYSLSTNIPIESITMRENLKSLVRLLLQRWMGRKPFPFVVDKILFPTVTLLPSIAISYSTTSIDILVTITGSFIGVWIQYLIAATLAYAGRYVITRRFKTEYNNKYKSPFTHTFFLILITLWTVTSVALVMAGDVLKLL